METKRERILYMLQGEDTQLTPTQMAKELGRKRASTQRLMQRMEAEGVLESADGYYQIKKEKKVMKRTMKELSAELNRPINTLRKWLREEFYVDTDKAINVSEKLNKSEEKFLRKCSDTRIRRTKSVGIRGSAGKVKSISCTRRRAKAIKLLWVRKFDNDIDKMAAHYGLSTAALYTWMNRRVDSIRKGKYDLIKPDVTPILLELRKAARAKKKTKAELIAEANVMLASTAPPNTPEPPIEPVNGATHAITVCIAQEQLMMLRFLQIAPERWAHELIQKEFGVMRKNMLNGTKV
jgi:DNA-binding Lrp family transcriptional regulator